MYEYDLSGSSMNARAQHRWQSVIPLMTIRKRNDYADLDKYREPLTVTDTYHETKRRFAWIG